MSRKTLASKPPASKPPASKPPASKTSASKTSAAKTSAAKAPTSKTSAPLPVPKPKRRPSSPLSVRRTSSLSDAQISPFLLDATSITPSTPPSHHHRTPATWLHLPVMLRRLRSRSHVLSAVHHMSQLRHPNLEQLLGAVLQAPVGPALLTEAVPGPSLAHILAGHNPVPFVRKHAIAVALDVARALLYFHARTAAPHAAVAPAMILFDRVRGRAVLLLADSPDRDGPCAAPEVREKGKVGFESDVYSLAKLILRMYAVLGDGRRKGRIGLLPMGLRGVVEACVSTDRRKRPSMEKLCQALTDCYEMDR